MTFESILYVAYSSITILISVITAFMFWKRRRTAGALSLSLLMFSAAEWTLSDLLSALYTDTSIKIMWNSLAYIGIAFVPVTWFVFSLQYTRLDKYLTRLKLFLLCIIPSSTIIFALTNNRHHFFKLSTTLEPLSPDSISIVISRYGPGFYIHTVYSYVLILLGTVLLLRKLIRLSKIYRNQAIIMAFASLIPLGGNILFVTGIVPSMHIDTTAFSFTISGLLCFFATFRYRLLDLIPAAREAVIESMDDIIIVLDNLNRIIDINTAAKIVFGMGSVNLIGQLIYEVIGDSYSLFKKYENTMKVSEKISIEKNDQKKFYDLRIFPLYDSKGKVSGRFIVLRDITLLEKTMIELEESQRIAVNASKAKSQFLATMSHEIRTPLNGIIGMTELLSSANLTDEEKTYLKTIEYSANSLLDIISDVLDFSKIEAGKMELENIDFNINELINNIVNLFLQKKSQNNLCFVCEVDKVIPQNITGDPIRLKQILLNIIGNAFKFTEKGSIQIRVKEIRREHQQTLLQFSISDTGIGIPSDKIDILFQSFHQLDSSTTRKYGGTGLGLAIVKNLITLMGGSITVESEIGKGSIFSFEIPFKISELSSIPGEKAVLTDESDDKRLKVLLAEDNEVNQMLIVKLLEKKGWIVDAVETGLKALDNFLLNDYDLILMDIQMPEMDGLEATIRIRESEKSNDKHIPIIALTANATEEDRSLCFQAGMDDFLSKPIKSEKLFACISKYIN